MKKSFNFHCEGTVSQEKMNVIYENDEFIVLSDSKYQLTDEKFIELDKNEHEFSSGDEYWIFNKSNGGCVNDSTLFGCKRTINV